jgi:hypothetical protein
MGNFATTRIVSAAAIGLWCLFALNPVQAAPPQNRPNQSMVQHLDLSAPSHLFEQSAKAGNFRSLSSRQSTEPNEHIQLPSLASAAMHAQPTMQERVQQFHRDGLPVARLWENNNALVHIGLNQKGKPGLWIVQKLH